MGSSPSDIGADTMDLQRIASHPSLTVNRKDVPVLLVDGEVTQARPIIALLQEFLKDPEVRFILVCESFDQMALPDMLAKLEDRLNIIVVECKGHLEDMAALTGATILLGGADIQFEGSPFGIADSLDVAEDNVVTCSCGEKSVTIKDAIDVMVIHATEEGELNDDETKYFREGD